MQRLRLPFGTLYRRQVCPRDLPTSHKWVRLPLRLVLTGRRLSLFWNLAALHGPCFQAVNDEVLIKANEAFSEVFYL
jgi:hypothetical protein